MLFKKQDGKETWCKIKDSESSATLSLCSADSCCNWWNSINICLPGYVELNIHTHWLLLWQIDPNASQLFARKLPSPLSLTSDCGCKNPFIPEVWKVPWHVDPLNVQSCQRFCYPELRDHVLTGHWLAMARRGSKNPSAFILRAPSPAEMVCLFAFLFLTWHVWF